MKANWSQTRSAKANRKYRLLHPEQYALSKLHWLDDPKNREIQRMMEHAWREQNKAHVREYQRLSREIYKARKEGNIELENKFRVERRAHCFTLKNRKTPGGMAKEVLPSSAC